LENFIDFSVLIVFISTFFFVSITPGMCMTLAMSLGISIGLKKTFFMMIGELVGVGIVATASVIGVAGIMLHHPLIFHIFKYVGGAYLVYLGISMWFNKGKVALGNCFNNVNISKKSLMLQGFITAIANPKGWAFFIALFPPFINQTKPLFPQISLLLIIILLLEFLCLILYASGGNTLRVFLKNKDNVKLLNKFAGTLMLCVGLWLAFG
jgi:homoserine/homoserine lactone efflux protein